MEFEEGNVRVTVAINEEDVVAWTKEILEYGEVTQKEVRAAAQRYIAERGLGKYRTAMQPLGPSVREDLVVMILEERRRLEIQPPDESVFLLPTDDLCERTDDFCPIVMSNKDCRHCQFYLG